MAFKMVLDAMYKKKKGKNVMSLTEKYRNANPPTGQGTPKGTKGPVKKPKGKPRPR
jgi:hypothetical protein